MTGNYAIMDRVARMRWFRRSASRRTLFVGLALLCGLASLVPRPYAARVLLAPHASRGAGLSTILGQFGGSEAILLASRQPVAVDLVVARSPEVRRDAARRLGLAGSAADLRGLERGIAIQARRGGIIEIMIRDPSPARALAGVAAYAAALQDRLAALSGPAGDGAERLADDVMMRIIVQPFVDPARQYNRAGLAALLLVVLAAIAAEFYVAGPPVGSALTGAREERAR